MHVAHIFKTWFHFAETAPTAIAPLRLIGLRQRDTMSIAKDTDESLIRHGTDLWASRCRVVQRPVR